MSIIAYVFSSTKLGEKGRRGSAWKQRGGGEREGVGSWGEK
jgi:hypothetical protein